MEYLRVRAGNDEPYDAYVGRGSEWEKQFKPKSRSKDAPPPPPMPHDVENWVDWWNQLLPRVQDAIMLPLRGKWTLACHCGYGEKCAADVLVNILNGKPPLRGIEHKTTYRDRPDYGLAREEAYEASRRRDAEEMDRQMHYPSQASAIRECSCGRLLHGPWWECECMEDDPSGNELYYEDEVQE